MGNENTIVKNYSLADYDAVAELLGREPRGLMAIPVRSQQGEPVVIQVASLVDGKPFPTLFWLVDKRLNYAIDSLEASGFIKNLQEIIDGSDELQQVLAEDHQSYIQLRQQLMLEAEKQAVASLGFTGVLQKRGIGGIENFSRIRCLHTYYAAHLVCPNTIGMLLDDHWQAQGIVFDHLS